MAPSIGWKRASDPNADEGADAEGGLVGATDPGEMTVEKFAPNGLAVEPGTPEALARRNKAETAKWERAIRDAKIEPQ